MKKYIVLLLSLFVMAKVAHANLNDTTRAVAVTGAINFRDLGGYDTKQGAKVIWGKLFRSGELNKLTDADLKLLEDKKIAYVIDFRGNTEVEKAKDRLPHDAEYLQLPAGSENVTNWMQLLPKLNDADSLMESFYSQIGNFKARYQPFFKILITQPDSSAIVFHCAAGKDRTGIAAALLLYALGVPQETILKDYLLSNNFRKEEHEKMIQGMAKMGVKEQVARDLATVKQEYLAATYLAIVSKYGSVDRFLKDEIGLSDKDIKTLRTKYTK